jgi:hypothetical protein
MRLGPPRPGRDWVSYAQLRAAAAFSPAAFRAFWPVRATIGHPAAVCTDPAVAACTREALRRHGVGEPIPQPSREQLLAALAS